MCAKFDIEKMITENVIKKLEEGNIPWRKPWSGVRGGAFNRFTLKPYSLLNQMLLDKDGEWATYKQWTEHGARLRKGEKPTPIIFYVTGKYITKINEETNEEEKIWINYKKKSIIYHNMYHISQVEGIEPLNMDELNVEIEPLPEANEIINEYVDRSGIKFSEEMSNKAYYSPMFDKVVVPLKEQYDCIEEYYSTTFHELTHSTGANNRLGRFKPEDDHKFGSEVYSQEELVAELGSATILGALGIDTERTFDNSTAYIQSWIKVLNDDTTFIMKASKEARKAANLIFGKDVII